MIYEKPVCDVLLYKYSFASYYEHHDVYEYIGPDYSDKYSFPEWKPGNLFIYEGTQKIPEGGEIFVNGSLCKQILNTITPSLKSACPILKLDNNSIAIEVNDETSELFYQEYLDGII